MIWIVNILGGVQPLPLDQWHRLDPAVRKRYARRETMHEAYELSAEIQARIAKAKARRAAAN